MEDIKIANWLKHLLSINIINKNHSIKTIDQAESVEKIKNAQFFVIKSYSEEDVFKVNKYFLKKIGDI